MTLVFISPSQIYHEMTQSPETSHRKGDGFAGAQEYRGAF